MWGQQWGYGDVSDMGTAVGSWGQQWGRGDVRGQQWGHGTTAVGMWGHWGQQWGCGDISGVMGTAVMGGPSGGVRMLVGTGGEQ